MNRRETIKSLLLGSMAAGLTLQGCAPNPAEEPPVTTGKLQVYGRTPEEIAYDEKLLEETYFNEHELSTIAVLCDLILPANDQFGAATDAGVVDFIAFIVKDMPAKKIPLRGGLMWLDNFATKSYGKQFIACSIDEQKAICDQIAYPNKTAAELKQGEKFFSEMRNLTLTGYYTSKMGIEDLGYKGNTPNVWDGVPEDVLQKHGLAYDEAWIAKCVDQSKRADIATWDDQGNLLS